MRYSGNEGNCCGVGLENENVPNSIDDSVVAATSKFNTNSENSFQEGTVLSNLPLLFVNGRPASLDKISLTELERFVTFMTECSLRNSTSDEVVPKWWPKDVEFSNPIQKPEKCVYRKSWIDKLKKMVLRCYTYYQNEYLLNVSSRLSQCSHDDLEYQNNYDSTTSLYHKKTGQLLLVFATEILNYDRKIENDRSNKVLLSSEAKISEKCKYSNKLKFLRPRAAHKSAILPESSITETYLCDNCDAEFNGYAQMQKHEKLCYRVEPRPPTPKLEPQPEIQKDHYMGYFNLKSVNATENIKVDANLKVEDINHNRISSRVKKPVGLTRYPVIPFSSPIGIKLAKNSKMITENIQRTSLEKIERYLAAPVISNFDKPTWLTKINNSKKWSVTYNRDKRKDFSFVHQYNFANYKNNLTLDLKSQLLFLACKPIYVVVTKVSYKQIEEFKRSLKKCKSPIIGDEFNPIIIEDEEIPKQNFVKSHSIPSCAKRPKCLNLVSFIDLVSSDDEK